MSNVQLAKYFFRKFDGLAVEFDFSFVNQSFPQKVMHVEQNPDFLLAYELITKTTKNVFLTGKAGTGKTTFLKHLRQTCKKNMVITASTGVAAINAEGMTLHSLLGLPPAVIVPDNTSYKGFTRVATLKSILSNMKLSTEKKDLLCNLKLLVVDEVSMIRCDTLDAVDSILQRVRNSPAPFGGVQLLLIGDLYQLPPVNNWEEWNLFNSHYKSQFFFEAKVYKSNPPLYVELNTIYRQKDEQFVRLLNRARTGELVEEDLKLINSCLRKEEDSFKDGVVLTTHVRKAEKVNKERIQSLPGESTFYVGVLNGFFPESILPVEPIFELKIGTRIMFTKNSLQYFNGQLATIIQFNKDGLKVRFDNGELLDVVREKYKNIIFKYDHHTKTIAEEVIGTFQQLPIQIAWAITIHKSQGLTLPRVRIDAEDAFEAGQVYVALSRCTSLEGISMESPITKAQLLLNTEVDQFVRSQNDNAYAQSILVNEITLIQRKLLLSLFEFRGMVMETMKLVNSVVAGRYRHVNKGKQIRLQLDEAGKTLVPLANSFKDTVSAYMELKNDQAITTAAQVGITLMAAHTEKLIALLGTFHQNLKPIDATKGVDKQMQMTISNLKGRLQRLQNAKWKDQLLYHLDQNETNSPINEDLAT